MRRVVLAVGVTVLAAAVALLLHLRGLQGVGAAGQGTGQGSAKITYLLRLEVEGAGRLLVNGTPASIVNLTRPFTALVEAVPDACYALKQLLVNGTPVSGSKFELAIGGNTTVKAVFERPIHTLLIVANAANASALVNGTLHTLPVELSFHQCSVVNVTPVAPRGYRPLNGSLLVNVSGDAELRLSFKRVVTLEFVGVQVPVEVLHKGGGERVEGRGTVEVEWGEEVHVKLVGADKRGCVPFNGTHDVCHVGWWNGSAKLYVRYLILNASSDTTLEQLVFYAPKHLPPLQLEIPTPSGMVEVMAYPPYLDVIVPITGSYRYLGDGWIEFNGSPGLRWILYIEMPPWRKLNVTCLLDPVARGRTYIMVVVRADQLYLRVGRIPVSEEVVYIIDWRVVERFSKVKDLSEVPLKEFVELFKCVKGCRPNEREMTAVGPTTKVFHTPAQVGWLCISGEGYARIRIEVLESP
ncbi:MAG: hypothetical protein QXU64_04820 [Thermofilaceae archaeon]